VRPDGYVATGGSGNDASAIVSMLARLAAPA